MVEASRIIYIFSFRMLELLTFLTKTFQRSPALCFCPTRDVLWTRFFPFSLVRKPDSSLLLSSLHNEMFFLSWPLRPSAVSFSSPQSPFDHDGHSLAQVQGGSVPTRNQAAEVQGSSSATPAHSSYSQSDNYGCHRTVFSRSFSVRTLSSFRSCEVSAYFPFRSLASLTDCLLSFFTHCFVVLPFTIFFFLWGECRTCVSQ